MSPALLLNRPVLSAATRTDSTLQTEGQLRGSRAEATAAPLAAPVPPPCVPGVLLPGAVSSDWQ